MLDLDRKVFGRDSIFVATNGLNGWLSKIHAKVKKVTKKFSLGHKVLKATTPKQITAELRRFESKHRKDLKKIGAVAAIIVAVYFVGPSVLAYVESIGGVALAQSAASEVAQVAVIGAIKKKMSKSQQEKMAKAAQTMTPAQFLASDELSEASSILAGDVAVAKYAANEPADSPHVLASRLLATEGVMEVQRQSEKVAAPMLPDWVKIGAPLIGLLALIS